MNESSESNTPLSPTEESFFSRGPTLEQYAETKADKLKSDFFTSNPAPPIGQYSDLVFGDVSHPNIINLTTEFPNFQRILKEGKEVIQKPKDRRTEQMLSAVITFCVGLMIVVAFVLVFLLSDLH